MPPIEVPEFMMPSGDLPEIDLAHAISLPDDEPVNVTSQWRDRIEAIRQADGTRRPEDVIVLLGRDARLVVLLSAWRSLDLRYEAPMDIPPPEDMGDAEVITRCWQRLWNPGNRDQAKEPMPMMVSASTGMSPADTQVALRVALQSRMIYPHGEIHLAGEQFLRIEATAVLLTRGAVLAAQAAKQK